MVKDYETVYRHMFHNKIGTSEASLFVDWAFMLEKYRRDFDSASTVYQEGLKRVTNEANETILL